MGMSGAPFAQQYGQAGVQQMGPAGVNAQQVQNKTVLANNIPQFPSELKGPGSVPNMVGVTQLYHILHVELCINSIYGCLKYIEIAFLAISLSGFISIDQISSILMCFKASQ